MKKVFFLKNIRKKVFCASKSQMLPFSHSFFSENALVTNYSAMLIVDLGVLMADVQCLRDGSGGYDLSLLKVFYSVNV